MAKVKDGQVSATVKMTLNVPRGLVEFLENLQHVGGPNPKEHLEQVLANELECIISDMPTATVIDEKFIRTRYGEGSDLYKAKAKPEAET